MKFILVLAATLLLTGCLDATTRAGLDLTEGALLRKSCTLGDEQCKAKQLQYYCVYEPEIPTYPKKKTCGKVF